MKAAIDPTIRQDQDIYYTALQTIKDEIARKINAEYHDQTKALRTSLDELLNEQKAFVVLAKEVLRQIPVGAKIFVITQNGKGSSNIVEHRGTLVSKNVENGIFNMKDDPDGKPFTIALNCCLVSIEPV
jgi:hypothetical protein